MTSQDEIAAEARAALFDTGGLAQAVIYTPKGGSGKGIAALITFGANPAEEQGRYLLDKMTAQVSQADVTAPKSGDTITLANGDIWTVRQTTGGDGLGIAWTLECTRDVRSTQRKVEA